ncbi:leukocyte elastase inhibitor C-like isoform X2 [Paramacrobiotus metropolitanus]|uniref:leukocyte elastase inhibitor C-like isoform X2 n=1 Tax=Paramacrobiotus metropolitanus TaxID=2943436 RepID=UPI00244604CE|nr:leukocyte elastase inhibitor C-like isoform X2 [Paramacrobiotus metropolitanus]
MGSDSSIGPDISRSMGDVMVMDAPADDSNCALRFINETMEKTTGRSIASSLTDCQPPILLNILTFKGGWSEKFRKAKTAKNKFYMGDIEMEVDMMSLASHFNYAYYEPLDVDYLEICYASGEASMLILLPRQKGGLEELEGKLEFKNITEVAELANRMHEVHLFFPKFVIDNSTDLTVLSGRLGVQPKTGASCRLLHAAVIDVHESGTGINNDEVGLQGAGTPGHPEPIEFVVDHPFMFLIRHNPTNCILFIGKLENANA